MRKVLSFLLVICAIVVILFCVLAAIPEKAKEETNTTQTEQTAPMEQQFMSLGFTEAEAKEMKEIFATVGITEIANIQAVGDNGIDNLQSFKCDIYDSKADKGGPSLLFTVENRTLCYISLNGFYNSKQMKYDSVVLYDIWNEDGTINTNSVGYKAVLDYDNGKITEYDK